MFYERIRKNSLLKAMMLLLFAVYYSGTTSFWHVHTEGGRRVVHSHPFTSGTPSHPNHTHCGAGFHWFQSLSSAGFLPSDGLSPLPLLLLFLGAVSGRPVRPVLPVRRTGCPLRAPPCFG